MDTTKADIGRSLGPRENYCDPGEIAAFGKAINDDNPMYQDGRAVPPTYAVVPAFGVFLDFGQPTEATAGGLGAGHGEHDLYIRKPITPGTTLHTTAELASIVTSKAGMNVFVKLTSVDDAGDTVIEQYWSSMYVGEVTGGDQGEPMADHSFPEEARAHKIGTMVLPTTLDQTFRYAGASGDRAIIHVNDKVGDLVSGGRGKFLQGMASFGIASRALVALAAGGDPRRIKRLSVRFTRYVFPGNDVEVSVYDAGALPDGNHAYAFEVVSGGDTVMRHGRVEVSPA